MFVVIQTTPDHGNREDGNVYYATTFLAIGSLTEQEKEYLSTCNFKNIEDMKRQYSHYGVTITEIELIVSHVEDSYE